MNKGTVLLIVIDIHFLYVVLYINSECMNLCMSVHAGAVHGLTRQSIMCAATQMGKRKGGSVGVETQVQRIKSAGFMKEGKRKFEQQRAQEKERKHKRGRERERERETRRKRDRGCVCVCVFVCVCKRARERQTRRHRECRDTAYTEIQRLRVFELKLHKHI